MRGLVRIQVIDGALRVDGSRDDEELVTFWDPEPIGYIGIMIVPNFGSDPEIRTQETRA